MDYNSTENIKMFEGSNVINCDRTNERDRGFLLTCRVVKKCYFKVQHWSRLSSTTSLLMIFIDVILLMRIIKYDDYPIIGCKIVMMLLTLTRPFNSNLSFFEIQIYLYRTGTFSSNRIFKFREKAIPLTFSIFFQYVNFCWKLLFLSKVSSNQILT